MARQVNIEEGAQIILEIFVYQYASKPKDVLDLKLLADHWIKLHVDHKLFAPSVGYALEKKWIELVPRRQLYRLTESGYAEAT